MAFLRFERELIRKNKSRCAVLQYLAPIVLFVGQPVWMHVAKDLTESFILVPRRPWDKISCAVYAPRSSNIIVGYYSCYCRVSSESRWELAVPRRCAIWMRRGSFKRSIEKPNSKQRHPSLSTARLFLAISTPSPTASGAESIDSSRRVQSSHQHGHTYGAIERSAPRVPGIAVDSLVDARDAISEVRR